jgi:hypothetical protein
MTMCAKFQHANPWRNEYVYTAWYCKIINLHYLNITSATQICKLLEQESEFYELWSKFITGYTNEVFSKRRSAIGSRWPRHTQHHEFLWCTLWNEHTIILQLSLDIAMNFGVRTHSPQIFKRHHSLKIRPTHLLQGLLGSGTQTSFDRWHYGSKERSDAPKPPQIGGELYPV